MGSSVKGIIGFVESEQIGMVNAQLLRQIEGKTFFVRLLEENTMKRQRTTRCLLLETFLQTFRDVGSHHSSPFIEDYFWKGRRSPGFSTLVLPSVEPLTRNRALRCVLMPFLPQHRGSLKFYV